MIATSFRIVRENLPFFAGLFVVLAVVSLAQQTGYLGRNQGVVTTVIWLAVTWLVQRAVLLDVKIHQRHAAADKSFPWFLAKGFVLMLIGIVASIPFILVGLGGIGQDGPSGLGYLVMTAGSLLCLGLVFSLLGTWLPAAIYGVETGIGAALSRGLRTFFPVLTRLLTANLLGFAILLALFATFGAQIQGAPPSSLGAAMLLDLVSSIIGMMTVIYTAVVLAKTYAEDATVRDASSFADHGH